ncbi:T9SS type A sorting domain-containing protein [Hymenobacter chitinivorans]|uniref:Putative secreted protein (Por secretion system target) n=1 Tax=Hymenobacter chitinivorans DSM 11115 TaxID=1121954 RepID=A0A2M9B9U5_9BACT|nr:T9SS type A sorting domain-containing protein [Hymenobacter chitinivorans]PJJ54718.1 putative secreted protein (Por secretion system target) [Hymenobacter chitinivorans DSM 11115]
MLHIFSFTYQFRNKLLVALFLLLGSLSGQAQAPAWQTAIELGQTRGGNPNPVYNGNSIEVRTTAADASGNIFIAGMLTGTVSFGPTTLTSAGESDIFVAKWSTTRNAFVWAQQAGGSLTDGATELVVEGSNIYMTGDVTGTANFGTLTMTDPAVTNMQLGYLVKLTDAGSTASFTWLQPIGNPGGGYVSGLAVKGPAVYLTGAFRNTISFGNTTLTSAGSTDIHVVKMLDGGPSASFVWAQRMGGTGIDYGGKLAVTAAGLYLTGDFAGVADFGPSSLTSTSNYNVFVAKLTEVAGAPNFAWVRQMGGSEYSSFSAPLAVSGTNVYVGGSFVGTARFGSTTITSLDNRKDGFITRLTDNGNSADFAWVQRAGGSGDTYVTRFLVQGSDMYVGGGFTLAASFGSTTLTNTRSYNFDVFVAKLTDTGNAGYFQWAQSATGSGSVQLAGLVKQGTNLYTSGKFNYSATFGTLSVSSPSIYASYLATLPISLATAVRPTATQLPLDFYPNPAHTTVQVPLATPVTLLTLIDQLGRTVRMQAGSTLPLHNVTPGLYLLQAATPGQPLRAARVVVE